MQHALAVFGRSAQREAALRHPPCQKLRHLRHLQAARKLFRPVRCAGQNGAIRAQQGCRALRAQLQVPVEAREVSRIHRSHHHTGKRAVRARDTARKLDGLLARHPSNHHVGDKECIVTGLQVDLEVLAVRQIDRPLEPTAAVLQHAKGIDDTDLQHNVRINQAFGDKGRQVHACGMLQVRPSDHPQCLFHALQGALCMLHTDTAEVGHIALLDVDGLFLFPLYQLKGLQPDQPRQKCHPQQDLQQV